MPAESDRICPLMDAWIGKAGFAEAWNRCGDAYQFMVDEEWALGNCLDGHTSKKEPVRLGRICFEKFPSRRPQPPGWEELTCVTAW